MLGLKITLDFKAYKYVTYRDDGSPLFTISSNSSSSKMYQFSNWFVADEFLRSESTKSLTTMGIYTPERAYPVFGDTPKVEDKFQSLRL